jgi:hypothetical protein
VRLRPGELAAARLTGQMSNFRTRAREVLALEQFQGFSVPDGQEEGSRGGAFVDTDLLIRGALFLGSGGVRYRDAEKRKLQLDYEKIIGSWDPIVEGFAKAVDFYRRNGVPSGDWLPYRYLLFAPAIAAARGHTLDARWLGWAIVASLWRHYVGEVDTKLQKDATLADKGDVAGLVAHVKARARRPDSIAPDDDDLLRNIVSEGGVFLAMLGYAHKVRARSFPGGKLLTGAREPLEVRRFFPRAILDGYAGRDNEYVPDRLGNVTLLSRSDNEELGDAPPEGYLFRLDVHDRFAHFIPDDESLWTVETFKQFCEQRERTLAAMIRDLLAALEIE